MKTKIVPIHPSHGEALEAFIAEALKYQQKEIEKAFKNKYKGAGDVFFPYESQGNCTEKEALDYIDEQWKDIINSLKAKEGSKE